MKQPHTLQPFNSKVQAKKLSNTFSPALPQWSTQKLTQKYTHQDCSFPWGNSQQQGTRGTLQSRHSKCKLTFQGSQLLLLCVCPQYQSPKELLPFGVQWLHLLTSCVSQRLKHFKLLSILADNWRRRVLSWRIYQHLSKLDLQISVGPLNSVTSSKTFWHLKEKWHLKIPVSLVCAQKKAQYFPALSGGSGRSNTYRQQFCWTAEGDVCVLRTYSNRHYFYFLFFKNKNFSTNATVNAKHSRWNFL